VAIQEMVATLPIARWMEQCSVAEILLSVRVGRRQEMTKNSPVVGTQGRTIIVGRGICRIRLNNARLFITGAGEYLEPGLFILDPWGFIVYNFLL
jgi:hypothetical protein